MGEGERSKEVQGKISSSILGVLERIEKRLEGARTEEEIAGLREELEKWQRVAKDRFPDELGSEEAFEFWDKAKKFDFETGAYFARENFGKEPNPQSAEPTISTSTSETPKSQPSLVTEPKPETPEPEKPSLTDGRIIQGASENGDDEEGKRRRKSREEPKRLSRGKQQRIEREAIETEDQLGGMLVEPAAGEGPVSKGRNPKRKRAIKISAPVETALEEPGVADTEPPAAVETPAEVSPDETRVPEAPPVEELPPAPSAIAEVVVEPLPPVLEEAKPEAPKISTPPSHEEVIKRLAKETQKAQRAKRHYVPAESRPTRPPRPEAGKVEVNAVKQREQEIKQKAEQLRREMSADLAVWQDTLKRDEKLAASYWARNRGRPGFSQKQAEANLKSTIEFDAKQGLAYFDLSRGIRADQNNENQINGMTEKLAAYKMLARKLGFEVSQFRFDEKAKLAAAIIRRLEKKEPPPPPPAQVNFDLSRLAGDITYHFLDDVERLKPKAGQTPDERFLEVSREVWRDIVYEGKFDNGNPRPVEKQDLDVRVSMFLLKRAGFKEENLLAARPERPGELVPGKINIDRGGRLGVGIEPTLIAKVEDKNGTYERPTVFMDNHPRFRPGQRGSSAHGLYELLREAGFFEGISERDRRAVEMMVQLTIDDDNASFPESAPGKRLEDFERSDRNLQGLAHDLKIGQIYDYFQNHVEVKKDFTDAYTEAVVARELKPEEIKKYELDKRHKIGDWKGKKEIWRTPMEDRRWSIDQARERLGKSRKELMEEGTIVETRLGTYVVDFVEKTTDKLLAGHDAVQAYGYDGYISYDLRNGSFLLNNMGKEVDLSKDEKLQKLAKECGAATVRGAMIIKPSGLERALKFGAILEAVGMAGEAKGKLKSAVRKPIPLEDGPGYKAILKKYFKDQSPEIWKQRFQGIGFDGHFRYQHGTSLEKSFIPLEEWEKVKANVRAEAKRREAERKARAEALAKKLEDQPVGPPVPEQSEREKIIAELRAELRSDLEKLFEHYPPDKRDRIVADMLEEELKEILREIEGNA